MKTALVTGALGQDGTYLTEHLLGLGYRVVGLIRRTPWSSKQAVNWALKQSWADNVEFVYGDVRDEASLRSAIKKAWPDEIYNLAGQVYVPLSWEQAEHTFDVNVGGLARILRIVEQVKADTKVYQASSSEMYGNHAGECDDKTEMWPESPYGISKLAAHRLVALYRSRGLFCVAGILFNHESPRRGHEMVTRKIARAVAEWSMGSDEILSLGNMDSRRDWGFAGEYVKAMHKMLQQPEADDYVVGTGVSHSVQEFLSTACEVLGVEKQFANEHTKIDERFVRKQEIFDMRADNKKIREKLGWEPRISFRQLVQCMCQAEVDKIRNREQFGELEEAQSNVNEPGVVRAVSD
jgi:GDPmannose 4,6-dehydratase